MPAVPANARKAVRAHPSAMDESAKAKVADAIGDNVALLSAEVSGAFAVADDGPGG